MAQTQAQTAGIAIGILVPFLLLTGFTITLLHRRRRQLEHKASDHESTVRRPKRDESQQYGADTGTGTVRRATGKPQTYSEWIGVGDQDSGRHERYPSLEHGPGPVIKSDGSSVYSSHPPTTHDSASTPSVARPITRNSISGSSFTRAVLEAASEGEIIPPLPEPVKKTKVDESIEAAPKPASRGYSGAWP